MIFWENTTIPQHFPTTDSYTFWYIHVIHETLRAMRHFGLGNNETQLTLIIIIKVKKKDLRLHFCKYLAMTSYTAEL
jgi:hypothetical protein